MVCAVEAIPYEKIKAQFKKGERISIVTCNTCTRSQDAGGAKLMEVIAGLLVKDVGVDIVEEIVLTTGCNADYYDHADPIDGVDKILCLGCWAGWSVIKHKFPNIPVVAGVRTLGIPAGSDMLKVVTPKGVEL
ncbi:MAG: hypothetical protein MUP60_02795 [Candidatus Thorarchaeota archaeon]|nr:hypothetical protein [Candidatus Thorarchaeota archaeon]